MMKVLRRHRVFATMKGNAPALTAYRRSITDAVKFANRNGTDTPSALPDRTVLNVCGNYVFLIVKKVYGNQLDGCHKIFKCEREVDTMANPLIKPPHIPMYSAYSGGIIFYTVHFSFLFHTNQPNQGSACSVWLNSSIEINCCSRMIMYVYLDTYILCTMYYVSTTFLPITY